MSDENRHINRTVTSEEAARIRAIAEAEHTPEAKAANAEYFRKLQAASEGNGFAAALRREIQAELKRTGVGLDRMAESIGVDIRMFDDFRTGDATLPSDAIERLVEKLGLHLTADAHSA